MTKEANNIRERRFMDISYKVSQKISNKIRGDSKFILRQTKFHLKAYKIMMEGLKIQLVPYMKRE